MDSHESRFGLDIGAGYLVPLTRLQLSGFTHDVGYHLNEDDVVPAVVNVSDLVIENNRYASVRTEIYTPKSYATYNRAAVTAIASRLQAA